MFVKSYIVVAAALFMATGCRDAEAATAPTTASGLDITIPQRAVAPLDTGSGFTTLSTAPAGYESWGLTQLDVTPDAGWFGETAYGQSVVNYYATDASADVSLQTLYGTSFGPSSQGRESFSVLWPTHGGMTAQTTVMVPKSCGYIANVNAAGEAFFKVLSGKIALVWDEKHSTKSTSAAQPKCSTTSSGGSTGGTTGGSTGYNGEFGDLGTWTEVCSYSETSYVDSTGAHTIDTQTCKNVYVSLT